MYNMNVGIINNDPPNSGVGRYSFELLSNLQEHEDVNAEMICTSPMNFNSTSNAWILGNPYLVRYTFSRRILNYFLYSRRIPKRFDVYHVSNQILGRFARFNHPAVITIHDLSLFVEDGMAFPSNIFLKKSIADATFAEKMICVSKFSKAQVLKEFCTDHSKIKVIYHGVDHELFKPRSKNLSRHALSLPFDKKIILHVGSEISRKNVPTLVKVFYKLKKQFHDAVLVRIGPKSKTTQILIDNLGLEKSVMYFSEVSGHYLALFYNAADLLAFPSFMEGFGFPPIEALSSGCPVVASYNGGAIPELIGNAGVLVDPLDVSSFASKITDIIINDELRIQMIKRGLERSKIFNWKKCAEETLMVYKAALNNSKE